MILWNAVHPSFWRKRTSNEETRILANALRRTVTRVVPASAKRRLRRALGRDVDPEHWRERLEIVYTADAVVVRGRVGGTARVVGLTVRPSSGTARQLVREQSAAAEYEFSIQFADLWSWAQGRRGRYDLFLTLTGLGSGEVTRRVGRFASTATQEALGGPLLSDATAEEQLRLWTHVTEQGNVSFLIAPRPWYRQAVRDLELRTGSDGIHGTFVLQTFARPARDVALRLQERVGEEVTALDVTLEPIDPSTRHGIHAYRATIQGRPGDARSTDPDGVVDPFLYVTYDDVDEIEQRYSIFRQDSRRFHVDDIVVGTDDPGTIQLWVPYVTFRGKRLAFWTEMHARSHYEYMRRLHRWAWWYALRRPFSRIWLIGEQPAKAQDNGYRLFRWIREHHPRRRVYYVIAADSHDRAKVEALGNVVIARSREHFRYALLASRVIGSHHAEFLHPSRSRRVGRHVKGIRIFLQHGVTAMKNVRFNYGRRLMNELPPDHVVVNSEREKQFFVDDMEYLPSQVHTVGFARFDELFARNPEPHRRVLVMPTWRDWFVGVDDLAVDEYVHAWLALLHDPQVARLRDEAGVQMLFVMHPNMRPYLSTGDLRGIDVAPPDADVQELIRSSAALITDYSSVAWDAAFLGRATLFWQYDLERFTGARTPFADSAAELPGPLCHRVEQVVAELVASAARDFEPESRYVERARRFLDLPHDGFAQRNYDLARHADGIKTRLIRVRNARRLREWYADLEAGDSFPRLMKIVFGIGSRLPRRNTVMFETDRGKGFGGSPRAIYEALAASDSAPRLLWSSNVNLRVPAEVPRIRRLSWKWYWEMSRARYWVSNQNREPQFARPKRTFFLQTWHGTPLKKMQNDVPVMYGRRKDYHAEAQRLVDDWSALVSPSSYATAAFRSAFGFDGPVLETGTPGNDVFHRPDAAERAESARRRLGLDPDRTVVLYAPTFRDDGRAFGAQGAWQHDIALDLAEFERRLGDDVTLLVRLHPLVKVTWPATLGPSVINASTYPDVHDLLLISDVLITDYSSVMFDFAQRMRPIVLFVYDIDHYRDTLRGFYVDVDEVAPGPVVRTSGEVLDVLGDLDTLDSRYADRLNRFRERFGSLEDGGAAQRVVEQVWGSGGSA